MPQLLFAGALEATGFGVQACEGRGTTVRATSMSISMPKLREAPFQKLHVSMAGPTSWSHQRLHQTSCVVTEASGQRNILLKFVVNMERPCCFQSAT